MGRIVRHEVKVTTTGSAGSATGSEDSPMLRGFLHAIYLDYHASAPATTDVTVAQTEAPQATLLTVSNTNTDGWYLPRLPTHDTAGAAEEYASGEAVNDRAPLTGRLTVSVAQADDLTDCVTAYIYVEQD